MAYESLKASLDAKIYTNGNEEVTASMVNSVISDCISQLGNFECGGEITPTTLFDFNIELKWWFIAVESGTYTNFDNIELDGEIAVILYEDGIFTAIRIQTSHTDLANQNGDPNFQHLTSAQVDLVNNSVQGQESSTVGYIAVADDTSGKSIKYVPVTIDDSGNVIISGNATINGTLTTINSETLQVKDKNIEIAKVDTPTDDTADGGGITLLGATNKTITWVKSKLAWVFNQAVEIAGDLNVVSGVFKINGTQINTSDLSDGADLVKGPASATDNTLPRFDLTTGKLLQAGGSITNLDNGNVGIGTTEPRSLLHVSLSTPHTSTPTPGTVAIFESAVLNRSFINIKGRAAGESEVWFGSESADSKGRVRYEHNNKAMAFWVDGSERMRLNTTGLGISTNNPTEKLHVIGNIAVSGTVDGRDIATDGSKLDTTVVGPASATDNAIATFDGTTGKVVQNSNVFINDSGFLGVGTESPTSAFQMNGSTHGIRQYFTNGAENSRMYGFVGSSNYMTLTARNDAGELVRDIMRFYHDGTGILVQDDTQILGDLKVNTNTLFVDAANNQVGIGTITPSGKLTIQAAGDSTLEKFIVQKNSSGNDRWYIGYGGTSTDLIFGNDQTPNPLVITRVGGKVGIGTLNPAEALDVVGNVKVSGKVDGRDVSVDGAKLDKISGYVTSNFAGKIAKTLDVNTLNAEVTLFTVPSGTMCKCGNMADSSCKLYIFGIKTGMSDDAVVNVTFKNFAGTERTRTFTLNTLGGDPYVFVCDLEDQKIGTGDVKVKVTTAGTGTNGDVIITTDAVW